jgi:hypothetical protein
MEMGLMGNQTWQILWRVAANVLIIVIAESLLELVATQLGVIAPIDATAGTKLVRFFLGGIVFVGSLFSIVWMGLPYIRPRSQTPDGY